MRGGRHQLVMMAASGSSSSYFNDFCSFSLALSVSQSVVPIIQQSILLHVFLRAYFSGGSSGDDETLYSYK